MTTFGRHVGTDIPCEDNAMIEYVLRWVNSGGGPEADIAARFDVSAQDFYSTVASIIDRCPAHEYETLGLSPVLATRIAAVARRRVWISN